MPGVAEKATAVVAKATGLPDWERGLGWIAEGHPLNCGVDLHQLVRALIQDSEAGKNRDAAVRRLVRELARSDLDPAAFLILG
jgi:hypothetical protein